LFFTGTLFLATVSEAADGVKSQKITDKRLIKILNYPEHEDLNLKNKEIEKNIHLILHKIPRDCASETNEVCFSDFYLAVSEYDEQPAQTVYLIEKIGELNDIEWKTGAKSDQGNLKWTIRKYSTHDISENPKLKQEVTQYNVVVSVKSLDMTKVK
jgi:hypothetical protein